VHACSSQQQGLAFHNQHIYSLNYLVPTMLNDKINLLLYQNQVYMFNLNTI
jgi:hypothetical protein